MLYHIFNTVTPIFILLFAGYGSVRGKVLSDDVIDGLMKFCTHIAIPCLLFRATSTIDLAAAYDWRLLLSYFGSAAISFGIAITIARKRFSRRPGEAVAVGFIVLYSNMVFIGLPIIDRAFDERAVSITIAIVSLNAPICYLIGIVTMESLRADGRSYTETASVVAKTMFKNTLMIGLGLGFIVNLSGLALPEALTAPIEMMKSAALPCGLFGLGGLLARYALSEELAESTALSALTLIANPLIAFVVCSVLGVSDVERTVIVVLASIPPGLNAYLFASQYSRGLRTASSNVLIGTVASIFTLSFWLWVLA